MDVTPPFGNDLSGYYYRRLADGVLDPLYLNAVAVSNGEETVILMAIDYIGVKLSVSKMLCNMISERTGVPADHVLIAALHQHTGPCFEGKDGPPDPIRTHKGHEHGLSDKTFLDTLCRKFADTAQMAIDDMREATMGTVTQEVAEKIAFVRRYFTKEKGVVTNPGRGLTLLKRCAEPDNTMRLVRFKREGAKDIAIVNFSTHPDVIGGTKWSADWPGFTRTFVEADNDDVSCIFFTGCQGDSNHVDHYKPKEERIKDGNGYVHSRYMGRTVADAVKAAWDRVEWQSTDTIFGEQRVIYNITNTEGLDKYDECKAWCEEYASGNMPEEKKNMEDMAYSHRVVDLINQPIFRPVPLIALGVGNVAFVGFGGEAFTSYGATTRALLPEKFVMCSVCTNGYEGYFPTAEAFEQGGYEAVSSFFTPTLEGEIVEALSDIFEKNNCK